MAESNRYGKVYERLAIDSGPKGRGFESRHFDKKPLHCKGFLFCFVAIRVRYE